MPKERPPHIADTSLSIGVTIVADPTDERSPAYVTLWRRLLGPIPEPEAAADPLFSCATTPVAQDDAASDEAAEVQDDSP